LKIKIKLTFIIAAVAAVNFTFFFLLVPTRLERVARETLDERAQSIGKILTAKLNARLLADDYREAEELFDSVKRTHNLVYIAAISSSGRVLASLDIGQPDKAKYIFSTQHGELSHDKKVYCSLIPAVVDGQEIARLYIGLPFDAVLEQLAKTRRLIALVSLLVFMVGLVSVLAVGENISRSLANLAYSIKAVTSGDLGRRAPVTAGDETGKLARQFNSMVDQWESAQREWGNLNRGLEERVFDRTQELREEIAERTRAEEELKRFAAKLERSNKELQDFAFVASHDLQEPLRKVQAFGDRLKAACGAELSDKGRDYLDRMQTAAQRMQGLIKDLLTFSRVTSKAQPFEEVDLVKVAREVLSDLEVTIEQLAARVELGELPVIEADPTQMRQLFQNLIGNGLKFRKKDQAPTVKVYCETAKGRLYHQTTLATESDICRLVVEDDGIGFEQKYCEKIFNVFQRLHGRSEYEGTGVGLAVCRKIVERHGGSITALSSPDQGARFIVELPYKQARAEKPEEPPRPDQEHGEDAKKPDETKRDSDKSRAIHHGLEPSIMQPVT